MVFRPKFAVGRELRPAMHHIHGSGERSLSPVANRDEAYLSHNLQARHLLGNTIPDVTPGKAHRHFRVKRALACDREVT